jgi:hypothetical protein
MDIRLGERLDELGRDVVVVNVDTRFGHDARDGTGGPAALTPVVSPVRRARLTPTVAAMPAYRHPPRRDAHRARVGDGRGSR